MKNSDNPQADLDNVQERWLDLYDHAPVGYCTVGDNGLIVETNLKAAALLGVAREELVFQTISRFVFKDDLESYHLHSRQLFETGAPQACELRMVKEDGTQFWARLEATVAQGPSTGPEQRMCRMVLSDITGRRKAEEALKESEERFRHMTEQL
ncbi:MAG: PAS domain S-box protein, partial [Myxococcota bacterium]